MKHRAYLETGFVSFSRFDVSFSNDFEERNKV